MPATSNSDLDRVFAALAHPVRRAILVQCGMERQSVADLARPHAMSLNAISKHIKNLESANLVSREVDGNVHKIGVRSDTVRPAMNWLSHHVNLWDESLLNLRNRLEADE